MPYPGLLHPEPLPLQQSTVPLEETLKHSSVSVSVGSLGLGVHSLFEPSECLWRVWGLILNAISPLLPSCSDSFALGCGLSPQSCSSAMQMPLQHLLSCWDFSDLGHGVSPQSHSRATFRYIATSRLLIRKRECLKTQRLVPGPSPTTCILRTLAQGKLSREYVKAVYCHPAYLTFMQSTL